MGRHRKQKIASVIRDIVSDAIHHRLQDPRIGALTTVTRVEVTADLLISRVYLSVHGGSVEEGKTLTAIRHAAGYIQRFVARELTLRQCPELRFEIDEALKAARRTLELLDENRRKNPALFASGNDEETDDVEGRSEDQPDDTAGSTTRAEEPLE
jgi:ribosome-binding factor A